VFGNIIAGGITLAQVQIQVAKGNIDTCEGVVEMVNRLADDGRHAFYLLCHAAHTFFMEPDQTLKRCNVGRFKDEPLFYTNDDDGGLEDVATFDARGKYAVINRAGILTIDSQPYSKTKVQFDVNDDYVGAAQFYDFAKRKLRGSNYSIAATNNTVIYEEFETIAALMLRDDAKGLENDIGLDKIQLPAGCRITVHDHNGQRVWQQPKRSYGKFYHDRMSVEVTSDTAPALAFDTRVFQIFDFKQADQENLDSAPFDGYTNYLKMFLEDRQKDGWSDAAIRQFEQNVVSVTFEMLMDPTQDPPEYPVPDELLDWLYQLCYKV
jgi:hypothetical protein